MRSQMVKYRKFRRAVRRFVVGAVADKLDAVLGKDKGKGKDTGTGTGTGGGKGVAGGHGSAEGEIRRKREYD